MADAVFNIAADITPEVDDRELERQAQTIAGKLNGILAKQVKKVDVAPQSGSFRPFQNEVQKATNLLDRFHQVTAKLPITKVAKAASNAFQKFTDVIDVTRRDIVGYGDSLFDTIRNTHRFREALDGVQSSASSINDLPRRFSILSSQIQSGTSVVDRFAKAGNPLAQMFQPVLRQGEAARVEFVELNKSVDTLTRAIATLAAGTGDLDKVTREVGKNAFQKQIESARKLQDIVKGTPNLFDDVKGSIDKALLSNSPVVLAQELVDIKNEAQKTTGPLGRIAQLINEKSGGKFFKDNTAAARELAIELEQGAIKELKAMGRSDLLGPIEKITAALRDIRDDAKAVANFLAPVGRGLVQFGTQGVASITSIGNSLISSLLGKFPQFSNEALTATEAMNKFVGGASNLDIAAARIQESLNGAAKSLGSFLGKNLTGPLVSGVKTLGAEFTRLGRDITGGLSSGIQKGSSAVVGAMTKLGSSALESLRTVLKSHSDSKETFATGVDTGSGFAHGILSTTGKVKAAISTLASSALGALRAAGAVLATTFAGLGAVAIKTGADFNILKQVVGSTLPVLVGSKQGAADLLDEVNKLNDSSPFARDAFLQLTQTLAGFGVEAKRITPLIDAIQQTVAATGGSTDDLLELGQAFAKIQAQGKVSADVLQSFSVRGVDAVAVLANGFKVTTGAMRDMISNGLVPADQAIDVLTKGLKEKFDGATAAVSKNFPGALQRVQARLRDIGGSLLKTFINPTGGGALVTFLNNMADALSHVNKELIPKLQPALEVVGRLLVGFSEQVKKVVDSLSGDAFGQFVDKLKPFLPLLVGLAALVPAAFGWIPIIGPQIAALANPFVAFAAAIAVFLAQSGKLGDVMDSLTNGFSGLKDSVGGTFGDIKNHLGGFTAAIAGTATEIGGGIGVVQKFVGAIGGVGKGVTSGIPLVSKLGEVFNFVGVIVSKFIGIFDSLAGSVLPTLAKIFPKLIGEGGALAGVFEVLSGPIGIVISIVVQMIATSQRFRDALVNLWHAVQPVVQVIGGALALAIKIVDEAIKSLEPVFTAIINILAAVFNAFKPVVEKVSEFIKFLNDHNVIENFFKGVKGAFEGIIAILQKFIDTYNSIPLLPNIHLKLVADAEVDPAKKAHDDLIKKNEELRKAAEKSASAVEDNFNKAAKAAENAKAKMDGAIDSLKQGLSSIDQKLSPLFEAAKGVKTAAQAVIDANLAFTDAQTKAGEDAASFTKLQKEQAKAFEDVIKPVDELGVAQRNLTRIQNGLRDSQRQLDDLAKERAKLTGEEAAQNRAGLARQEERAVISLNKAKQAQLDLENELNNAGKVSIDLTGLSLDQIRAKLATARNTAKAKGNQREKTPQEIADETKSAALDVADAEQGVADSKAASLQFEEDTKNRIRDIDEQSLSIQDDIADKKLDEAQSLRDITRLRAGDNSLAQLTLDWDEKIRDAKKTTASDQKAIETAAKGIQTATEASKEASLQYQLQIATIKGDTQGIANAQTAIWQEQLKGINLSPDAITAVQGQINKVGELLTNYKNITAEVQKQNKLQAGSTALQGVGGALSSFENLGHSIENASATGNDAALMKLFPKQDAAKNELFSQLRAALNNGAAEQKNKQQEPWFPTGAQVEAVIKRASDLSATRSLRDAIRDALNGNNPPLSMPGFAAARGLSPGMIHRGMHDGKGLVRMFEYGKEAVLPLTRPTDMARIIGDPSVLPAVMKALPGFARGFAPGDLLGNVLTSTNSKLRMMLEEIFKALGLQFPGFAAGYAPGDTISAPSMGTFSVPTSASPLSPILNALPRWSSPATSLPSSSSPTTDLAAVVRTARNGGRANADVYENKGQREFAGTIGDAVKVAMKEAIAESDGLGNNDVDIHVNPNATETQRAIAREVKRQLDKRTGKW